MKRILSSLLATGLLLSTASFSLATTVDTAPLQEIRQETLASGVCGPNATYVYNESTGLLTISGTGITYDYEILAGNPSPWEEQPITVVKVEDGITSIGENLFRGLTSLETVYLPDSLTSIGYQAFYRCTSLRQIYIPNSVTTVDNALFSSPYDGVATFSPPVRTLTVYGGANSPVRDFCDSEYLAYQVVSARPDFLGGSHVVTDSYPDWMTTFTDFAEKDIITDLTVSNYDQPVSRGLLAVALSHMYGGNIIGAEGPFTDTRGLYFVTSWCYDNNIITGVSDTLFAPHDLVTREQMALILQKFATFEGKYGKFGSTVTGDASQINQYNDVSKVSSWATQGVTWAVANGFMSGSHNSLNPNGNITRAELAVMLYQYRQI